MSKRIFKYRLPFMEIATVQMPFNSQIVRVDDVDGAIWIWAVIDDENPLVEREFFLFKTGVVMPDDILENYTYLGCGAIFVQMELMMYVYEKKTYVQ